MNSSVCFNTTFVTVLYIVSRTNGNLFCVSIQLLLLFYFYFAISKHIISECFNTTFVTVLFLHNYHPQSIRLKFQYNFCYCSIFDGKIIDSDIKMFQYNFCYCSMCHNKESLFKLRKFQYNFCYCSILSALCTSCLFIVSIQLLLLFYVTDTTFNCCVSNVSIQLLLLFYLVHH